MVIPLLQTICKPLFGTFEKEEFKKFLRMGLVFALIIGSYWTLRVLKNSIFGDLVNPSLHLPWAKGVSLLMMFPLVGMYTKLLDKFSREKMFYVLSAIYSALTLLFGLIFVLTKQVSADQYTGVAHIAVTVLAYAWYVFVESYGSLFPALFWAFATDITIPDSAKKGFPLVVAIGQIGGIFGPWLIGGLPKRLGISMSGAALFACVPAVFLVIACVRYLLKATPKDLLTSFHGKNETVKEHEQEPGFFEGLKLLLSNKYLIGIFSSIAIYEVIITIFDYNFQILAKLQIPDSAERAAYLSAYGSYVNLVALVCLLLGVSNITRLLGVGVALVMMPIIVGGALTGFMSFDSLHFLFWLMVGSKAINYALNGPAMKQLYIPTTHDVRFKAQAWIETFGSRGAKEGGMLVNALLVPFQKMFGEVVGRARYIALTGYLGFSLLIVWFFFALFLGRTYKKAVDNKQVVC